jgi:hypothetical protein
MSFLFTHDKHWSVANWVSRGFFEDAKAFLEEAPALADDVKFCIETDTDTVDFRGADGATLRQLLVLVDRVIAANHATGSASFHNPEAFPVYMQLLEDLRNTLVPLIATAT